MARLDRPRTTRPPALATCVRTMGERSSWTGSASDLLRLCAESVREEASLGAPWAKNPRALAGRLRRAQTFLRMLDIEIAFGREGRSGARMIRMSTLGPGNSSAAQNGGNGRTKPCVSLGWAE